jgi:hypothetical protein
MGAYGTKNTITVCVILALGLDVAFIIVFVLGCISNLLLICGERTVVRIHNYELKGYQHG